ncbi:MAG: hypothetical protein ONB48_11085 [candidate division KSB1 bacterium]|nr:hypothetical protein [candidate division KSB1 bacterium]MDZ7275501.1 hypothetical protein [candidate division KSB1 bacterium]MDZ7286187.1 hypothetical protein [candidate division KSB1 bacterium]MDZ7296413.1 hypothetical protein [candidate division KSB1 bacterium]MDZ7308943.1 hypothetical protein [candidate division KSB1 bacterium]
MAQKSRVLLIASWLIVRLRTGLLSTSLSLQRFLNQPAIFLIVRRESPFVEGRWRLANRQLHFLSLSHQPETIEIRSLPPLDFN